MTWAECRRELECLSRNSLLSEEHMVIRRALDFVACHGVPESHLIHRRVYLVDGGLCIERATVNAPEGTFSELIWYNDGTHERTDFRAGEVIVTEGDNAAVSRMDNDRACGTTKPDLCEGAD